MRGKNCWVVCLEVGNFDIFWRNGFLGLFVVLNQGKEHLLMHMLGDWKSDLMMEALSDCSKAG